MIEEEITDLEEMIETMIEIMIEITIEILEEADQDHSRSREEVTETRMGEIRERKYSLVIYHTALASIS